MGYNKDVEYNKDHELHSHFAKVEEDERRSNIERIVTSYRHPWDIYAELLQNSIDAIFEAKQTLHPDRSDWKGKIEIVVDSERRCLKISDNGIGIPPERIAEVIVLGRSLKRENVQGSRYGFMGYGLTFVAFQTSYMKIESTYQEQPESRSYKDLYAYVFNDEKLIDADKKDTSENLKGTHGTTVSLNFDSAYCELPEARRKDLDKLFGYAKDPKCFEYILRTRTAVGNTEYLFGKKPPCGIEVMAYLNEKEVKIPFKYLDLLEVLEEFGIEPDRCHKLSDFEQQIGFTRSDPPAEQDRKRKVPAIWHATKEPLELGEREPKIIVNFYIFVTSKEYLNRYNKLLNLENTEEELTNGVFLSLDGMPTSIRLDNWSHASYLPFTVIVDAQYLRQDLDAGRKGITNYRATQLLLQAEKLIKEKKLYQYRRYVIDRSSVAPSLANAKDLMEENVNKEKVKKGVALSQRWFPPQEEQEVITLFIELVGTKKICGYYLMRLSGYEQYDGLFEYRLMRTEDTVYNELRRPFGVPCENFQDDGSLYKKLLVEFKRNLESIYDDIHHYKKDLKEIDLIVCWAANEEKIRVQGDELIEMDEKERFLEGVTHKLKSSEIAGEIPVICLKAFLNETGY